MEKKTNFFRRLGVYGFDHIEPLIIAALVSEDPVLLIGKAGTGKTYLLNSISEAMCLEHRHYNASLISFDDLVGFPYPSGDSKTITFLPTPATIWEAESVLVDELSRCKPETQNKFFSIIHERKVQGLKLPHLRYRWAAMNPFTFDGNNAEEQYEGSQPLDEALADRFSFVIVVPDWMELTTEEQEAVIYPAGEGAISDDNGDLIEFVVRVKPAFERNIAAPLPEIVIYSRLAATLLTEAGFRMSPRRARLLARNITALCCVTKEMGHVMSQQTRKALYKLALQWSLPHRAWKDTVPAHIIDSTHAEAARLAFTGDKKELWVSVFLLLSSPSDRITTLLESDMDMDVKSLAVMQMLTRESKAMNAVFSFAVFPLVSGLDILNEEALSEIARIAKDVIDVSGNLSWRERINITNSVHPTWSACLQVLNRIPEQQEQRRVRAKQLFLYLMLQNEPVDDPEYLEAELNGCFIAARNYIADTSLQK